MSLQGERSSLDFLADKIEGWVNLSPKRNLSLLQKKTGVSYSTLRRTATRESLPSEGAMVSILSVVAEPEEILSFLKKESPAFFNFYTKTLANHSPKNKTEEDIVQRLSSKDSFICLALAYTIGARRETVERLLGTVGLNTLYLLADEGFLKENDEGVLFPNTQNQNLEVFNQSVFKQVSRLIAEVASNCEQAQNLFFLYNVTAEDQKRIMDIFSEAEAKALDIARKSNGDVPLIHSTITANLLEISEIFK